MKKIMILSFCLAVIQGCTRASNSDSTKIQIKLPPASAILKAQSGQKLSQPTSHDEINCYSVFVGGPDPDLQRNSCRLGSANSTGGVTGGSTTTGEIKFGDWMGGFPAGGNITVELPSGRDRVVFLIGAKVSAPEFCHDFKSKGIPNEDQMSNPFVLGVAGQLNLKPGDTVEVPIEMKFDSTKSFVGCSGPDSPGGGHSGGNDGDGDGDNDGPPGTNFGPYLRLEGLGRYDGILNRDIATVGKCYDVKPSLHEGMGTPWINPDGSNITFDVSNVSFGQFHNFAGCSSPTTTLTIEAGTHRALGNYSVLVVSPVVNQTMSGIVVTGTSSVIALNQQPFDIGLPRIVIQGPKKVVRNECYSYVLHSNYFEGGPLMTSGTVTGSLTENASFAFRQSVGCSGGQVAEISSASYNVPVFFKMISPATTVNLESHISMPGYTVDSFEVQTSTGGDHQDGLAFSFPNNTIVRGKCTRGSIRLVNFDGGAVTARWAIDIRLKVDQGMGVFYSMPDCSGSETDVVSIPVNQHEIEFGFRAHAIPEILLSGGQMLFRVEAGALTLRDSMFSTYKLVSVVNSTETGILMAEPPSFTGAEIVGSHEFTDSGTNKFVPLHGEYTNLSSVHCSNTPGTGFSVCPGTELDTSSIPYKYKWSATAASSGVSRWVRFVYPDYFREIKMSGSAFYGPKFKVLVCDAVAPASGDFSTLTTAAVAGPTLCLPAGGAYVKANSTAYILNGARRSLVGHSSGTSALDASTFGGDFIQAPTFTVGGDHCIANLSFLNSGGAAGIYMSSLTSASATRFEINNINYNTSTNSVSGVWLYNQNDPEVEIYIRNSFFYLQGSNSYGVRSENSSHIHVEDMAINMSTGGTSYGINFSNSGSGGFDINVLRANVTVGSSGLALKINNLSMGGMSTGVNIKNSVFKRNGSGNAGYPVNYIGGKLDASNFSNNIFMADNVPNSAILETDQAGQAQTLSFMGNSFMQSQANIPVLKFSSDSYFSDFSKNSFAFTGGGSTSAAVLANAAAYLHVANTSMSSAHGENVICSIGSNNFSSSLNINGGSLSGNLNLSSAPFLINNLAANTYRCQGDAP